MKKYKLVCKKGEGTFSEVVKAENIESGNCYAIKCMKTSFDSAKQVNNLREIQALRRLTPHPNIIHLEEVLYDEPSGRLAMVFELMEQNLYDMISGRKHHLEQGLIRRLAYQIFTAILHMHSKGIFHRDIKPENILVDPTGQHLKIADLGSCRSIPSKNHPLTEYIATRWYRSPECLLTDGYYGPEMDVWAAGCVVFEITALFPLFPGSDELDQINRIHNVLGTPSRQTLTKLKAKGSSKINYSFPSITGTGIKHFISHAPQDQIDLLNQTLIYDYSDRIQSSEILEVAYFDSIRNSSSHKGDESMTSTQHDLSNTSTAAKVQSSMGRQEEKKLPVANLSPKRPLESSDGTLQTSKLRTAARRVSSEMSAHSKTSRSLVNQSISNPISNNASMKSPTSAASKGNSIHSSPLMKRRLLSNSSSTSSPVHVSSNVFSNSPSSRSPTTSKSNNITVSNTMKPRITSNVTSHSTKVAPSVVSKSSESSNSQPSPLLKRRIAANSTLTTTQSKAVAATSPKSGLSHDHNTTRAEAPTLMKRRIITNRQTLSPSKSVDASTSLANRRLIVHKNNTVSMSKSVEETSNKGATLTTRRVATNYKTLLSKSVDETSSRTSTLARRRINTNQKLLQSKSDDEVPNMPTTSARRRIATNNMILASKSVDETSSRASILARRRIATNQSKLLQSKSEDEVTNRSTALARRRILSTLEPTASSSSQTSTLGRRRVAPNPQSFNNDKSVNVESKSRVSHRRKESETTNMSITSSGDKIAPLPSLTLPTRLKNKYSHVRSSGYGRSSYEPKNVSAGTTESTSSSNADSPPAIVTESRTVQLPSIRL